MIKLNDSNMLVGHIKQLLHTFNLPCCDVGYENRQPNRHYVDGGAIYLNKYENDLETQIRCDSYQFGKRYDNLTSSLKISNDLYDRTTHRYLGRYLRFVREYWGLDLMSMYNLFDEDPLDASVEVKDAEGVIRADFPSDDAGYACYKLPITKAKYTIYVNSVLPVEITMCIKDVLSIYSTQQNKLLTKGYVKVKTTRPMVYDASARIDDLISKKSTSITTTDALGTVVEEKVDTDNEFKSFYMSNRQSLQLLIKVPKTCKGPIVILEGDFTRNCSSSAGFVYYREDGDKTTSPGHLAYSSHYVRPQLLSPGNSGNYLLADRLTEYITSNAISRMSEYYDIRKVQRFFIANGYIPFEHYGVWSERESADVMKFCGDRGLYEKIYDITGAVDSDVESAMNEQSARNGGEGLI